MRVVLYSVDVVCRIDELHLTMCYATIFCLRENFAECINIENKIIAPWSLPDADKPCDIGTTLVKTVVLKCYCTEFPGI